MIMPNTQGNTGGQQGGQKFVERVEMAIMQYLILDKAQQGEVTKENLKQTFKGNLQMHGDHFDHCLNMLVQEKHLKEVGGKYTITDDGREDVQKLQSIILEVPNVIQGGGSMQGQAQKGGMAPQKSVGGSGNVSSGSTTGSTMGNQGASGSSTRQGADVGGNQPTTSGGNAISKGGATQPTGNKGNPGNAGVR